MHTSGAEFTALNFLIILSNFAVYMILHSLSENIHTAYMIDLKHIGKPLKLINLF